MPSDPPADLASTDPAPTVRLTEYSHGAGCGCKISPGVLDTILSGSLPFDPPAELLVGNGTRDDAAAYDLGNGEVILSTTDFFMPIADDPFDFGRIAAANAISDIYAMGGTPLMAIAILGWPVDRLPAEVARQVVDGGRHACAEVGIPLAGGHSIDSPEPIFGLAVTGRVSKRHLKRNDTARIGALLYLTKPLGIGILTTAQKQKKLRPEHATLARDWMCRFNRFGAAAGGMDSVSAMTDVTGFGLMGHLLEVCDGSGVHAEIELDRVPVLPEAKAYLELGCVPGGTRRNLQSYGHRFPELEERDWSILCDPQTSGGLLLAVDAEHRGAFEEELDRHGISCQPFGRLLSPHEAHAPANPSRTLRVPGS